MTWELCGDDKLRADLCAAVRRSGAV